MIREPISAGDHDGIEAAGEHQLHGDDVDDDRPDPHDREHNFGGRSTITGHSHDQLPGITCVPCLDEGRVQPMPQKRAAS